MTTQNETPAPTTVGAPTGSATSTPKPAPAKTVTIPIDRITVMRFPNGTDRVTIYTGLPSPDIGNTFGIELRAKQGTGADWCRKHFPGIVVDETVYS